MTCKKDTLENQLLNQKVHTDTVDSRCTIGKETLFFNTFIF